MKCGISPEWREGLDGWCSSCDSDTHECKNDGILWYKICSFWIPYTESLPALPKLDDINMRPFINAHEGLDV